MVVEGTADWVIDLGPEGGDKGGEIVAEGTPEQVAKEARSYTGQYLAPLLNLARVGQSQDTSLPVKEKSRRSATKLEQQLAE